MQNPMTSLTLNPASSVEAHAAPAAAPKPWVEKLFGRLRAVLGPRMADLFAGAPANRSAMRGPSTARSRPKSFSTHGFGAAAGAACASTDEAGFNVKDVMGFCMAIGGSAVELVEVGQALVVAAGATRRRRRGHGR